MSFRAVSSFVCVSFLDDLALQEFVYSDSTGLVFHPNLSNPAVSIHFTELF